MGQKHRHRHRHHQNHHGGGGPGQQGGGGPQFAGNQQQGGGQQGGGGGPQQEFQRYDQGPQRGPRYRVIVDLDEALGIPLTNGVTIVGFQKRAGVDTLLDKLCRRHTLLLWSAGSKRYVEKILGFGLRRFFREIYSADDLPATWKDPRKLKADYVIDVVAEHQEAAKSFGLSERFIIIPAYGSLEDEHDPQAWVKQIEALLLPPLPPLPQPQPQFQQQQQPQQQPQQSHPPTFAPPAASLPQAASPAVSSVVSEARVAVEPVPPAQ